jgi:glutaredoxin
MKTLTVYTKPNCIYCKQAKEYLTSLEIPFEEVDVMSHSSIRERLVAEGHKTLPVIYGGDKVLVPGGYQTLKTMRKEDILERLNDAS